MTTTNYQPGDIVNGHELSQDGTTWVPVSAAPQPPVAADQKRSWVKRHKVLTGVGAVAALAVVVAATGGSDGSAGTSPEVAAGTDTAVEAPAAEAPAVEAPAADAAGIGTAVQDGKFEFVVTDVETGVAEVGDQYLNQAAQGSFTLVTMTVKNIGDEPQTFFSDNVKAYDGQGRELSADSTASLYATPNGADAWMSEINPGNGVTVTVVFDVAPGESLTSIQVHDSMFSGGKAINLS